MYMKTRTNTRRTTNRRILANDDVNNSEVSVDSSATELVFEAEDVAELVAEVSGEDVEVVADENAVTFTVGDTDYTVESDGQEEILESTSRCMKGKRVVRANRDVSRRSVSNTRGRTVRRIRK